MNDTQFLSFRGHGRVRSIGRDHDGYGYTDTDSWTMRIRISGWTLPSTPESEELIARSRLLLEEGTAYEVSGIYYQAPGENWNRTFLCIHEAVKSSGLPAHGPWPDCGIIGARIIGVTNTELTLGWRTWDQYEMALYTQNAKFKLERPLVDAHTVLRKNCEIVGIMGGQNDQYWTYTTLHILSPGMSAHPVNLITVARKHYDNLDEVE